MKNIILFTVLFITWGCLFGGYNRQEQAKSLDWEKIEKAWNLYSENQNEKNAKFLCDLIPGEFTSSSNEPKISYRIRSQIFKDINILENRLLDGCVFSAEVAFRLISISDGAFGEALIIILGDYIKKKPEVFLQKLSVFPDKKECCFESFLLNVHPDYYDNLAKEIQELELRRRSLETVSEESLESLKQKSLKIIDEYLTELRAKVK